MTTEARWPSGGWAAIVVGDDLHVVPVVAHEPDEPAAGHALARDCWCRPTVTPVSDDPLPLTDYTIWSHHEPTWPGANVESDA